MTQVPSLQLEAAQLSSRLERLLREPQLEEFLGLGAGGEEIEDGWRWAGYVDIFTRDGDGLYEFTRGYIYIYHYMITR